MPLHDSSAATDYLAERYRAASHAPDCDHYIYADDLAALGITLEGRSEARVPRESNELLKRFTAFTFTLDQHGALVMAVRNADLAGDASDPLDFVLDRRETRLGAMVRYIRNQITDAPTLMRRRECAANAGGPVFRFNNAEDFLQFDLTFRKANRS